MGEIIAHRPAAEEDGDEDDEDLWAIKYPDGDQEEMTLKQVTKYLIGAPPHAKPVTSTAAAAAAHISDMSVSEDDDN